MLLPIGCPGVRGGSLDRFCFSDSRRPASGRRSVDLSGVRALRLLLGVRVGTLVEPLGLVGRQVDRRLVSGGAALLELPHLVNDVRLGRNGADLDGPFRLHTPLIRPMTTGARRPTMTE